MPSFEDEAREIENHAEYIRKMLRWTIHDLERFINLLKARVQAEEAYVRELSRVPTRLGTVQEPEQIQYNQATTFHQAVLHYETSMNKLADERNEYINVLRDQINVLSKLRDAQVNTRKEVKSKINDISSEYTTYRSREFAKIKRNYDIKYKELLLAQQQEEAAEHGLPLAEEPRRSMEGDHDDNASVSSIPDHKKKVNAFMAQVRTQFAAATANINDSSKQTARVSKIKKELHEADLEYRNGVFLLEMCRKDYLKVMDTSENYLKLMIANKADKAQTVLSAITNTELQLSKNENNIARSSMAMTTAINFDKDMSIFTEDHQSHHYPEPEKTIYTTPLCSLPLSKCITAVEAMGGLEKEGIYRISGRQSTTDALKLEFEKDEEGFQPQQHYDVFTIASVLKIYLRELDSPLFPFSVQDRMIYSKGQNPETRQVFLEENIKKLPPSIVTPWKSRVNAQAEVNKMNVQNLSYMFTPAIFHDHNQADSGQGEWKSDLVFQDLILNHDKVFTNVRTQLKQLEQQRRQRQQVREQRTLTPSPHPSFAPSPMPPPHQPQQPPLQQPLQHPLPPPPYSPDAPQPPVTPNQLARTPPPSVPSPAVTLPTQSPSIVAPTPTLPSPAAPSPAPPAPTSPAPPVLPKHQDPPKQESSDFQKAHGIIRRATLKARQAIPPRQASLRRRNLDFSSEPAPVSSLTSANATGTTLTDPPAPDLASSPSPPPTNASEQPPPLDKLPPAQPTESSNTKPDADVDVDAATPTPPRDQ
ncbi:hypothetical protein DM01DRAFT_1385490 [Hesseltinella vesiculosa]|uniref:Rho-GAP domain-containing protein n=1 Tax=Hesseltinella vesiculosa TaxID=101127 RepID=A0A1X2G9L0_9FUNG|nr:hypothetical protein DM01DRAFT_1385490 [Hesseltinella vesiculosa]